MTEVSESLSQPLLATRSSKLFGGGVVEEKVVTRSEPASNQGDFNRSAAACVPPDAHADADVDEAKNEDAQLGARGAIPQTRQLQHTEAERIFLLATKKLPDGSRVSVSLLRASEESVVIHVPAAGPLASLTSINPWSCKKLILGWCVFFYLLVQQLLHPQDTSSQGFTPYHFGGILLAITSFLFILRLLFSGALIDEKVHLQPQAVVLERRGCCRTKTTTVDKCEILSLQVIDKGVLVKCAGTLLFGIAKTYLVGRCLSKVELEALAIILHQYSEGSRQQNIPPV